jgi:CPA1 family monovalent cation:H+ antiporter
LQVVVLLGVAVVALTLIARTVKVAPPILLLAGGVALAYLPRLENVRLPPELVLLISYRPCFTGSR